MSVVLCTFCEKRRLINADTSESVLQKLKIEHSYYISASQHI